MKTMTIRDVPDALHAVLKERAKANRRSLNQQVIAELGGELAVETAGQRNLRVEREIQRASELRRRMKGFMTAAEIDAAKRAGRA